jgi:multidrug efflux pump
VVLVGLASKNAILIVEFAKQRRLAGASRREATLDACRLRLRPIIMTSFAFILGVVPLIMSHGAGAEMRKALGVAVFSGMLGVTLFGLALTPVFFAMIDWLSEARLFAASHLRSTGDLILAAISLRPLRRWSGRRLNRPGSAAAPAPTGSESKLEYLPARGEEASQPLAPHVSPAALDKPRRPASMLRPPAKN